MIAVFCLWLASALVFEEEDKTNAKQYTSKLTSTKRRKLGSIYRIQSSQNRHTLVIVVYSEYLPTLTVIQSSAAGVDDGVIFGQESLYILWLPIVPAKKL